MILTKEIEIKINSHNRDRLISLGYDVESKSKILIDPNHLTHTSNKVLDVQCDVCGFQKKLRYMKYLSNYNRCGYYSCGSSKCSSDKNNYVEINKKRENTMMERFGVKTNIILPDTHKKAIEASTSNESKEKRKQTNLDLYGFENANQNPEMVKKSKETSKEKYGYDHPMKSDTIKERLKNSIIEKYGVEHHMMVTEIKEAARKGFNKYLEENGLLMDEKTMSEWEKYNRNVRSLTNSLKRKLFNQWDGFDYYDGEYILENLSKDYRSVDYPNVYHKISVIHGFRNNIPIEEIANISNLCITKSSINVSKNWMTEDEFRNSDRFPKNKKPDN